MSFKALEQASPENFTFVINDLNLDATVARSADVAVAWVNRLLQTLNDADAYDDQPPNTITVNRRRLIVGISTTGMDGTVPQTTAPASTDQSRRFPKSGTPFFGETAPLNIPTTQAEPSTSFRLTDSSLRSSATGDSSIQLTPPPFFTSSNTPDPSASPAIPKNKEIVEDQSDPLSSNPNVLGKLKGPMDSSAATSSTAGQSTKSKSAALILCCGNECLVFFHSNDCREIPNEVVNFLFNRNQVTLVGSGVRRDGDWLGRPETMLVYRDPWELGEARAWRGLQLLTTLDQLAGKMLGKKMAIKLWPSEAWYHWPLKDQQQPVACLDAFLLCAMGRKMVAINKNSFACRFMYAL